MISVLMVTMVISLKTHLHIQIKPFFHSQHRIQQTNGFPPVTEMEQSKQKFIGGQPYFHSIQSFRPTIIIGNISLIASLDFLFLIVKHERFSFVVITEIHGWCKFFQSIGRMQKEQAINHLFLILNLRSASYNRHIFTLQ